VSPGWLEATEWRRIQALIPILCVDALPIRHNDPTKVGLILRETPHQGRRWCLLGGRVRRGESLQDALAREWHEALGLDCPMGSVAAPIVVEYRPDAISGRPHDPRQHSVSLTYAVAANDETSAPAGEALGFGWFDVGELDGNVMGFGQETVVAQVMAAARFESAGY
jgi:ADP-ribose pyrophosphatase YjhB (NUDIX family)